ncbi:MAG: aspartate aminotransferase family protein, partial [SAR202 cluster bacterium]|nr:aspartate aminotransferase family protein [SAR202 cluster bacterium]
MSESYNKSKSLYQKASKALAGGVSSQIRLTDMPTPLFFENGSGAKLWDVDGNEYIDYVLGQGPNIFGHAPEFL